nr:hypothetical protein Pyn_18661 [Ipomoea batatas]
MGLYWDPFYWICLGPSGGGERGWPKPCWARRTQWPEEGYERRGMDIEGGVVAMVRWIWKEGYRYGGRSGGYGRMDMEGEVAEGESNPRPSYLSVAKCIYSYICGYQCATISVGFPSATKCMFSIDMNNGSISVGEDGSAVARVEADGHAPTRIRVEGVDGFEAMLVEDIANLQLILFPTTQAPLGHLDRALPLPIQVNFHLRNLGAHSRIRVR